MHTTWLALNDDIKKFSKIQLLRMLKVEKRNPKPRKTIINRIEQRLRGIAIEQIRKTI